MMGVKKGERRQEAPELALLLPFTVLILTSVLLIKVFFLLLLQVLLIEVVIIPSSRLLVDL